ncbi:hypothetical protein DPMN_047910 [Dreissena polymorpha]|uniref:Uncharacterized protein n=1 Tax=Dreissena polymorpha TaxID=45954 RepID=A0A9D4HZL1_DREPO|nr:hypothetical protein DPMN_047910 [Dreissena polymorpha]
MKATLICAFLVVFLATSSVFGTPVNNGRGMGGVMGGKEMLYEWDGEIGDDGMMYDYDGTRTGGQMGDRNVRCRMWCRFRMNDSWRIVCCLGL